MCIRAGFLCRGYVSSRVYLSSMKNKTNFKRTGYFQLTKRKIYTYLKKKKNLFDFSCCLGFCFVFKR
jgi:hypothetical protein